jgi:hypothetical protein
MVIDLCAFFRFHDLYLAAVRDFHAVDISPTTFFADEHLAKWGAGNFGVSLVPKITYPEEWVPNVKLAAHHVSDPEDFPAWDAIALACLARNRHPYWAFGKLAASAS